MIKPETYNTKSVWDKVRIERPFFDLTRSQIDARDWLIARRQIADRANAQIWFLIVIESLTVINGL